MSKLFILPLYLFWLNIEFHIENIFCPNFEGFASSLVASRAVIRKARALQNLVHWHFYPSWLSLWIYFTVIYFPKLFCSHFLMTFHILFSLIEFIYYPQWNLGKVSCVMCQFTISISRVQYLTIVLLLNIKFLVFHFYKHLNIFMVK